MTPRRERPQAPSHRGVTLLEMLIVVTLLAIVARISLPSLNGNDAQRLEVAASEVRDALRFARSEALRRGKSMLVDAESTPGQVRVMATSSACSSFSSFSAAIDPRSKSAYVVNITAGAFSGAVAVTPNFLAAGSAYGGLIFDASGKPADVCQVSGKTSRGAPEAGSSVLLTLGAQTRSVFIDRDTGRITTP